MHTDIMAEKWKKACKRIKKGEENILFWLACEELKKETNPEAIEEKARFIYEDYISILSPKEVSLDSRVREIVNRNMVEPTPHTFDEAQLQIYTLMHRDSYPRFINSSLFKTLAQIPDGVSASGSKAESPSN
uniref:CSON013918 protein n=1 Tax=Culicoides sonorensis TaxID=179676 RepID=A0A336MDH0_CULSO